MEWFTAILEARTGKWVWIKTHLKVNYSCHQEIRTVFGNVTDIEINRGKHRNISGKTYEHDRVGMRELVLDDLDNWQDASTDLLRRVPMVVGAHPQHYNLQTTKEEGPGTSVKVYIKYKKKNSNFQHRGHFMNRKKKQNNCQTFGLMLSSSPLLSRQRTCCVASPPTPKFRQWRGENSSLHIYRIIFNVSQFKCRNNIAV